MMMPTYPPNWSAPSPHAEIRRAHIKAECNIKSIGVLCIIGGALALLAALNAGKIEDLVPGVVGGGLALASGILLRGLNPVGRILYTVLGVLGLFANAALAVTGPTLVLLPTIVVQTAVVALFLYLLWTGGASVVFGAAYRREVVPATPQVRPVSSPLVIGAFIAVLVMTIAGGLIAFAVLR